MHPRSWAPRQLIVLDALPMLANGKVDRVQLAASGRFEVNDGGRHGHHDRVVGGHHDRAVIGQRGQGVEDQPGVVAVLVRGRLVEDRDRGHRVQRPGQADPLPLTERDLAGEAVEQVVDRERGGQRGHVRGAGRVREGDVVLHGQRVQESQPLRHEHGAGRPLDGARGGPVPPGQDRDQRALAGAGRTGHHQHVGRVHGQAGRTQREHGVAADVVRAGDVRRDEKRLTHRWTPEGAGRPGRPRSRSRPCWSGTAPAPRPAAAPGHSRR